MASQHLNEESLVAWRALLNAHAAVTARIERDMAAAGALPLGWYDVLVALAEAPHQRLRMHELADAVVLSRSGLSRLVDRLEAAGLLIRERSTTDRRGAYAVLTAQGLTRQRASWPAYAQGIHDHFACLLDQTSLAALTLALEHLVTATASAANVEATATAPQQATASP